MKNIEQFEKFNLLFRFVRKEDAAFIIQLRTDPSLSKYLSSTSADLESQIKWIEKYQLREENQEEFYFIALTKEGEQLGLNRIYNIEADAFEIGSWLYKPGLAFKTPILGDLCIRDFGFEKLSKRYCKFEVRKNNLSVVRYHKRFNPEIIDEDDLNYYFRLSYENYLIQRNSLIKSLT